MATKKNYLPKSFYGLSGNSIKVKSVTEITTSEDDDIGESVRQMEEDHLDTDEDVGIVYEVIGIVGVDAEQELAIAADLPPQQEMIADDTEDEEVEEDEDRFEDARE